MEAVPARDEGIRSGVGAQVQPLRCAGVRCGGGVVEGDEVPPEVRRNNAADAGQQGDAYRLEDTSPVGRFVNGGGWGVEGEEADVVVCRVGDVDVRLLRVRVGCLGQRSWPARVIGGEQADGTRHVRRRVNEAQPTALRVGDVVATTGRDDRVDGVDVGRVEGTAEEGNTIFGVGAACLVVAAGDRVELTVARNLAHPRSTRHVGEDDPGRVEGGAKADGAVATDAVAAIGKGVARQVVTEIGVVVVGAVEVVLAVAGGVSGLRRDSDRGEQESEQRCGEESESRGQCLAALHRGEVSDIHG